MAFLQRYQSAPTLFDCGDNTYVVKGLKQESSDEGSSDDESPVSVRVVEPPLFSNDESPAQQENVTLRKKHQAPMPPLLSSRESMFKSLHSVNSTDSSDNQIGWSPSTSTESDTLPALSHSLLQVPDLDPQSRSPHKERSRFSRLRNALRSPQIGRSKSKKERGEFTRSKTIKSIAEDETPVKLWNNASDVERSPKLRANNSTEAEVEMSRWIVAVGCDDLEADQDFEITKVSDYCKYLEDLLQDTERTEEECNFLSQIIKRVREMVDDTNSNIMLPAKVTNGTDMEVTNDTDTDGNSTMDGCSVDILRDIQTGELREDSTSNKSDTSSFDTRSNDIVVETDNSYSETFSPSAVLFKPPSGSRWSTYSVTLKNDVQLLSSARDLSRLLIKETQVRLTAGMQSQERYLFLFSDLLIVAKCKTNAVFKLKSKVWLRDVWLASCVDEVFENDSPVDRSFVLGWPTTNFVAIFSQKEIKEEWFEELTRRITQEKAKFEGKIVQLTIVSRAIQQKSCQIDVDNNTTANVVLQACLEQMDIASTEVSNYQLWVKSVKDGKDASMYPLFGHEVPFSIHFNQLHQHTKTKPRDGGLRTSKSVSVISEENPKCEFFIKQKKNQKKNFSETPVYQKSMKKTKRSPNFINNIWKRIRPTQALVFGQSLDNICDENHYPPEAIIKLMVLIYRYGPNVNGILRRGNNAALAKQMREKIDGGIEFELQEKHTPTAASVFKEFIRSIPEGLVLYELHDDWVKIKKDDPDEDRIIQIKRILDKLPPTHFTLVKLTICLLQHLAKHHSHTQMGPSNLATCIAPSFFSQGSNERRRGRKDNENQDELHEITHVFTPVITFMIIKHIQIFGQDVLNMFEKYGCQQSPMVHISEERSPPSNIVKQLDEDIIEEESFEEEMKNDGAVKHQKRKLQNFPDSNSGTDSDSLHSLLSLPTDTQSGLQQDTSSIDSLVDKEDFSNEIESSPTPVKSHLSPTNLSRDSGLTLSDTQLYDEDVGLDFIGNTQHTQDSPILAHPFNRNLTPRRPYKSKTREKEKTFDSLNSTQKFTKPSQLKISTEIELKENELTVDSLKEVEFSESHFNLSSELTREHRMIRQSSADESVSPVSTHASVFSLSEEGSIRSAPQTPDDLYAGSLDWRGNNDLNQVGLKPSYFDLSNFSKSESNLKLTFAQADQSSNGNLHLSKTDSRRLKTTWKSHEAEEITSRKRYQPQLVLPPRQVSVDDTSPTSLVGVEQKTPPYIRIVPVDHIKGSPPPNVILQSFNQSSHFIQNELQKKPLEPTKSVDSVFKKDTTRVVQKRPSFKINFSENPDLEQVSQHVLMNCQEPVDITEYERERQKEISARAKAIYEESLQKYREGKETGYINVQKELKHVKSPRKGGVVRDSVKTNSYVMRSDNEQHHLSNTPFKESVVESSHKAKLVENSQLNVSCDLPVLNSVTPKAVSTHDQSENSEVKKTPKDLYLETIKQYGVKNKTSVQPSALKVSNKLSPTASAHSAKPLPFKLSISKAGVNDLHRSQSDAVEVRLKSQSAEKVSEKTIKNAPESVTVEAKSLKQDSNIETETVSKTDLHNNFLKAKNFFHQTESHLGKKENFYSSPSNLQKASSVLSLHSIVSNDNVLSKSSPLITAHNKTEIILNFPKQHPILEQQPSKFQSQVNNLLESNYKVTETLLPSSRLKSVSTNELSLIKDRDVRTKLKPELPWSVKNLKSQWDKEDLKSTIRNNGSVIKTHSSFTSQQHSPISPSKTRDEAGDRKTNYTIVEENISLQRRSNSFVARNRTDQK